MDAVADADAVAVAAAAAAAVAAYACLLQLITALLEHASIPDQHKPGHISCKC